MDVDSLDHVLTSTQLGILDKQGEIIITDLDAIMRILEELKISEELKSSIIGSFPYTYLLIRKTQ